MATNGQEESGKVIRTMTPARAAAILEAYGAEPSRWPQDERASLAAFLKEHAALRDAAADAAAFDRVLGMLSDAEPSAGISARVLADFDRLAMRRASNPVNAPQRFIAWLRDIVWPGVPAWQPASALAVALAVGLAAGAFVPTDVYAQSSAEPELSQLIDQTSATDLSHGN